VVHAVHLHFRSVLLAPPQSQIELEPTMGHCQAGEGRLTAPQSPANPTDIRLEIDVQHGWCDRMIQE
jgi:hypothetical protein